MSVNSIRNLLEIAAKSEPEKIGLRHGHEQYSYAQLIEKVDQIAHYLTTLGLEKGSRIGIYSNKRAEQVIAILAVLSTGMSLCRSPGCSNPNRSSISSTTAISPA